MRYLFILLLLITLSSCGKRTGFHIEEITIVTKDVERLADWYVNTLEFSASENNTLLQLNDFSILLEENIRASHRDSLKNLYDIMHVPGFFKVGFLTNQFDNLIASLRNKDVEFVGSIIKDEVSDRRSQIIKDPDGNRIQLFEDNGRYKLKPYFVSLIVENIGEQEKWYQLKFQVTEMHNLDIPEKDTYIRLLEGEDFLIELINTSDKNILEELSYDHVIGYNEIVIHGARGSFSKDHEGHAIVSP